MPVIVIARGADAPAWLPALEKALASQGFTPRHYTDHADYIARLVDDLAAMLIVDGDAAGAETWVTAAKRRAATRRIPAVVVSTDPVLWQIEHDACPDLVLAPDDLRARLPGILKKYARVPSGAWRAEVTAQCMQAPSPRLLEAIRLFNAGEYYAQHEHLEALWQEEPGPVRQLYQGILQVGVAYHHLLNGKPDSAHKMLLRSVQWLAHLPDICCGVDVRRLREDAARVRAALEAGAAPFDRALLRPVMLAPPPGSAPKA